MLGCEVIRGLHAIDKESSEELGRVLGDREAGAVAGQMVCPWPGSLARMGSSSTPMATAIGSGREDRCDQIDCPECPPARPGTWFASENWFFPDRISRVVVHRGELNGQPVRIRKVDSI